MAEEKDLDGLTSEERLRQTMAWTNMVNKARGSSPNTEKKIAQEPESHAAKVMAPANQGLGRS